MRHQFRHRGHNGLGSTVQSGAPVRNKIRQYRLVRHAGRHALLMLVVVGSLSLTSRHLAAQALYGAVTGNVSDASGAPVTKAQVTLVNNTTSESRVLASDDSGWY